MVTVEGVMNATGMSLYAIRNHLSSMIHQGQIYSRQVRSYPGVYSLSPIADEDVPGLTLIHYRKQEIPKLAGMGLSYSEIANKLDMTPNSVRHYLTGNIVT